MYIYQERGQKEEETKRPNNKNLTNCPEKTKLKREKGKKKYSEGFELSNSDSSKLGRGKGGERGCTILPTIFVYCFWKDES